MTIYPDDKVQAIGSPKKQFGLDREEKYANRTAIVKQVYANRIRVWWDGEIKAEDGRRDIKDFKIVK